VEDCHVVAIHEASHAVAACRLGFPPERLDFWISDTGIAWEWGGCVVYPDPEPVSGRWARQVCLDTALIALAGRAGEAVMGVPPREYDRRDMDEATRWLERIIPRLTPRQRERAVEREFSRAVALLTRERQVIRDIANVAIEKLRSQFRPGVPACQVSIRGNELFAVQSVAP
jgi:hypothetical protein